MDVIRDHHQSMRDRLARRAERALARAGRDDLNGLIALLQGELLEHARAEHDHLYPTIDELIREHGRATATMDIDHEMIEARVHEVTVAVERLRLATERLERTDAKRALREALLKLDTLLDVHMEKEERVYLPLLERYLSESAQRELAAKLEERPPEVGSERTLDVRTIPHALRHEEIFDAFHRLAVGDAFVLLNDHDPRPLAYEMSQRYPGAFRWEDLQRGPVWRVRISKLRPA